MDGVFVRVLGPVRVERDGVPVPLGSPQCRAVFALLLIRRNDVVTSDQLIEALWVGAPPPSARTQLHGRISMLRKALTSSVLETVGAGYQLCLADGRLDLDLFREQLRLAEHQYRAGKATIAAGILRRALDDWGATPFADVDLPAVRAAAGHLAGLRLAATEQWAVAELAAGTGSAVIFELTRAVAEHPYHERLRVHLMTALADAGRPGEALATYREGRRLLVEDLGIEPSQELQTLHQTILTSNRRLAHA